MSRPAFARLAATIQNLTVTNSAINEHPCGDGNTVF
jgi:hypothetical protein